MMSFRVYPPDYNPPLNQTPDGAFVTDDRIRVEKWGKTFEAVCCARFDIPNTILLDLLNELFNESK